MASIRPFQPGGQLLLGPAFEEAPLVGLDQDNWAGLEGPEGGMSVALGLSAQEKKLQARPLPHA